MGWMFRFCARLPLYTDGRWGLPWLLALLLAGWSPAAAEPRHGIAMHGEPLYPSGFDHFAYVNPGAPKGGDMRFAAIGSFDSLNPFVVQGTAALGLREWVFESLMARSYDEPFSLYGLLADRIETPADRSSVTFHLNPRARFSDGKPVTVDDVVFSLSVLRDKGRPNYKTYYSKVLRIEYPAPGSVRFVLDNVQPDREMPLILGLMPIIPRHIYEKRKFELSSLLTAVGSGPYMIETVEPGKRIIYKRRTGYWGKDLPVMRGQANPDRIIYEYFRDTNASFEAFKAGLYDARPEDNPTRWTTGYRFPAVQRGDVRQMQFATATPSGMRGFVFNTRREIFSDRRVREALTLLFDFEWVNRTLFRNVYKRTQSYFDSSELSSHSRPADTREKQLLAPFPDAVPREMLEHGYRAPVSDGSGVNRANRARAIALLRAAGYEIRDGIVRHAKTGAPLQFEIMVATPDYERLALVYASMARKTGVDIRVRNVDSSQYQARIAAYDYDMIVNEWTFSLSPGNEQSFYWGSEAARSEGTRNYMGVKDPAIDAMIDAMLKATAREDFVSAVRALDRVLLSGHYVIPLYHQPVQWIAMWKRVGVPEAVPLTGYRAETWWIQPQAK